MPTPDTLLETARLTWAQATLAWVACPYLLLQDELSPPAIWGNQRFKGPFRASVVKGMATFGVLTLVLHAMNLIGWLVIGGVSLATITASGLREKSREDTRAAELEIGTLAGVLAVLWWAGGEGAITHRTIIQVQGVSAHTIGATALTLAVLIFLAHGGNLFVRGVLDKAKIKVPDSQSNVGRYIGALERIVMATVVAAGSYEALAFLVTAKGLLRSKKLEEEHLSEYFLVGNLASVALAIAGGLAIRAAIALA